MRLRFKLVIPLILVVLVFVSIYQGYWLYNFYHEQYAKMEVDIMTSMRNADEQTAYQQEQLALETLPFSSYYNFLQAELLQKGIHFISYTEVFHLQTGEVYHRLPAGEEAVVRGEYTPYVFPFDPSGVYAYRLNVKQPHMFVLKQMSGLLFTSLGLILLLFVSYFYLLKIIFRQKNLDEIKSDFVNNMTHELKTPLAVAYAANDALLNYGMINDEEKREKYLKVSQEQLVHLTGLVEQILTMSVEERKNLQLNKESIPLRPLFENLKHQYSLQAGKPVEIFVRVEPEELSVQADRVHFRNVVCNLIENAIKYSGESVRIEIGAGQEGNKTRIYLSDNGVGIPAQALPKLFDKFYRVSTGDIHNVKGYGLGLSYVKTIIEKLGGRIHVESKLREGSCFYIDL